MPTGILVMHWDERMGVEVLATYPENITIQDKTLMQVYSTHEFSGEAGMVSLSAGAVNLASYYTGPESGVYVILLLTSEEDADAYEEGLAEISQQILKDMDPEALAKILPPLFQRLSVYPTLNEEQRLAMIYGNSVKRMILKRLREEALIQKSELVIWLKDQYEEGFVDIDSVLSSLIKNDIVKIASVKGIASDVIFLARDLMVLRIPPKDLLLDPVDHHLPRSLVDSYKTEVRNFFKEYKPSEEDNIKIIDNILLDPAVYETLKLLREAFVTRNDIEKLKKKGVDNVDRVLKILWENKMLVVFQDENEREFYGLLSDFYVGKYYPRYNLDNIRRAYRERIKSPIALIKAIDLMKDEYYNMLQEEKSEKAKA